MMKDEKIAFIGFIIVGFLSGLLIGMGTTDYLWTNEINGVSGIPSQWYEVLKIRYIRAFAFITVGILLLFGTLLFAGWHYNKIARVN
jgi:hypothetical protein